jgi:hypothetical protein
LKEVSLSKIEFSGIGGSRTYVGDGVLRDPGTPKRDSPVLLALGPFLSGEAAIFLEPALATAIEQDSAGERWIHEIKFDGYRVQLHITHEAVTVYTRRASAIIDREIVVPAVDGNTDFSVLQNELKGKSKSIVMVAFDLLYFNSYDQAENPRLSTAVQSRKRRNSCAAPALSKMSRARRRSCDSSRRGAVVRAELPGNTGTHGDGLASEADHFHQCPVCSQWIDMRYLGAGSGFPKSDHSGDEVRPGRRVNRCALYRARDRRILTHSAVGLVVKG